MKGSKPSTYSKVQNLVPISIKDEPRSPAGPEKKGWMAHDGISYCSTLLLPHLITDTNSRLVQKG